MGITALIVVDHQQQGQLAFFMVPGSQQPDDFVTRGVAIYPHVLPQHRYPNALETVTFAVLALSGFEEALRMLWQWRRQRVYAVPC